MDSDDVGQVGDDADHPPNADHHRSELWREACVMALYLSIVMLATLAVLPDDYGLSRGDTHHDPEVLALVWGTTFGLALAHWFAFELTAVGFGRGRVLRADLALAGAQLAGAAAVAIAISVVLLFNDDETDVDAAAFAPSLILGVAGYVVGRAAGRSVFVSMLLGVVVLVLGLAVASVKAVLGGH